MTRKDHKKFVKELIREVEKGILAKLPDVPCDWDGHELRQLIADHFALASFTLRQQRGRYRRYLNETRVKNLV